jgi:hypothetical protein
VQRGRIEYEGETSVYTQISPLKIRGKDEYILIFPIKKTQITPPPKIFPVLIKFDTVLHTHFSPRKNEYILVFPPERSVYTHFPPGKISIYSSFPLIFRGEI